MKEIDSWKPTKFEATEAGLKASRDPKCLKIDSRINASFIASCYNDALPKYAKGKLLDLGCGNVPMFGYYRQFVDEVVCADWDNSEHSNRFLDEVVDLNLPLPFEADAFDTILLSDVIEHLPRPESLFGELNRVLRPEGAVLVNVPFLYPLHEEPFDFHRYTKHRLQQLAEEAGFAVERLEGYGAIHHVTATLIGKCMPLRYGGKLIRHMMNGSTRLIDATPVGTRLRLWSRHAPLGYFMVVTPRQD